MKQKPVCAKCGAEGPRLRFRDLWFCNWMCKREWEEIHKDEEKDKV